MTHPHPLIRVMVVDDSAVIRGLWARLIDAEDDLQVVASAWHGRAALEVLERRRVDVVLLDVEMPEMDGLEALPGILALDPSVRVIMASSLTAKGASVTLRALGLGAADYVTKPTASRGADALEAIGRELVGKIRALGRPAGRPAEARTDPEALAPPPSWSPPTAPPAARAPRIVGITSSTGGPNALTELLSALPLDFPLPIVIVQHMPPLFTAMLADRLARVSGRTCIEARDGLRVEDGCTYVAPGDHHLTVRQDRPGHTVLTLNQDAPENFCRPSADPLFRSLAQTYGPAVLGVVLTGMGHDGLAGAGALRAAGARVLVQDEATSVVWGMPGAVARAGLADAVLPLAGIAAQVTQEARAPR
ncbi:MAG: chemotaxis response regulator protein-glutamate methylesterase [Longimicrobiales bacterium]